MNNARSVLLFSNKGEIVFVMGQSNRDRLYLNLLNNVNWLMHFNKSNGSFEIVDNKFNFSKMTGGEIYVVYDELDVTKLEILKKVNVSSKKVHIAFHRNPDDQMKKEIRTVFSKISEETILPRHESSTDGFIYSQVYNSLYNLYYDAAGSKRKSIKTQIFFKRNVSSVDKMVDVIFARADKTTSLNDKLELLHQLLTPEGIETNEKKVKEYLTEFNLKFNLQKLKKLDFMNKEYQAFLVTLRDRLLDNMV